MAMQHSHHLEENSLSHQIFDIVSRPGNSGCAECPERRPTWVSLINDFQRGRTLGVFICENCHKHHLKLGKHFCRVKKLPPGDAFTAGEVRILAQTGNEMVNSIYEAKLKGANMIDNDKKIISFDAQEEAKKRGQFIKNKYIRRKYLCQEKYNQQLDAEKTPRANDGLSQSEHTHSTRRGRGRASLALPPRGGLGNSDLDDWDDEDSVEQQRGNHKNKLTLPTTLVTNGTVNRDRKKLPPRTRSRSLTGTPDSRSPFNPDQLYGDKVQKGIVDAMSEVQELKAAKQAKKEKKEEKKKRSSIMMNGAKNLIRKAKTSISQNNNNKQQEESSSPKTSPTSDPPKRLSPNAIKERSLSSRNDFSSRLSGSMLAQPSPQMSPAARRERSLSSRGDLSSRLSSMLAEPGLSLDQSSSMLDEDEMAQSEHSNRTDNSRNHQNKLSMALSRQRGGASNRGPGLSRDLSSGSLQEERSSRGSRLEMLQARSLNRSSSQSSLQGGDEEGRNYLSESLHSDTSESDDDAVIPHDYMSQSLREERTRIPARRRLSMGVQEENMRTAPQPRSVLSTGRRRNGRRPSVGPGGRRNLSRQSSGSSLKEDISETAREERLLSTSLPDLESDVEEPNLIDDSQPKDESGRRPRRGRSGKERVGSGRTPKSPKEKKAIRNIRRSKTMPDASDPGPRRLRSTRGSTRITRPDYSWEDGEGEDPQNGMSSSKKSRRPKKHSSAPLKSHKEVDGDSGDEKGDRKPKRGTSKKKIHTRRKTKSFGAHLGDEDDDDTPDFNWETTTHPDPQDIRGRPDQIEAKETKESKYGKLDVSLRESRTAGAICGMDVSDTSTSHKESKYGKLDLSLRESRTAGAICGMDVRDTSTSHASMAFALTKSPNPKKLSKRASTSCLEDKRRRPPRSPFEDDDDDDGLNPHAWEKPDWAKKTPLKKTTLGDKIKTGSSLAKPVTHVNANKDESRDRNAIANRSILGKTALGEAVKAGSSLARPVTHVNANKDESRDRNPIANKNVLGSDKSRRRRRATVVGDTRAPTTEWEKPQWAKSNGLRKSEVGTAARQGQNLALPVTMISEVVQEDPSLGFQKPEWAKEGRRSDSSRRREKSRRTRSSGI